MHKADTVTDAYTSDSYGEFGGPTGTTGTLGHAPLSHPESADSGGPVSSGEEVGTGTPAHGSTPALFVATNLDSWRTERPHVFARDVQINDTAYRRLDPEYYAWLRSRMNLAKMASEAGQLGREDFDILRRKFNNIHEWAVERFGEAALLDAVRNLDARVYLPPVAESEKPIRAARAVDATTAEAMALVDAIRDRALALGWTQESLYGTGGSTRIMFGRERGLVSLLKAGDQLGDVTTQSIEIILANNVRQRFYNPNVEQPWIRRVR